MMASTPDSPAGALRIYGNLSLLEMAPVLLAAGRIYPGKTVLAHGGVMSLWGKHNDLPSLNAIGKSDLATNSETQVLRSSYANPDLADILLPMDVWVAKETGRAPRTRGELATLIDGGVLREVLDC